MNRYVRIACAALAFLLLMFILTIHLPQLFNDDLAIAKSALVGLLKDSSLLGGCLMIMGIYKSDSDVKAEEIEDEGEEIIKSI